MTLRTRIFTIAAVLIALTGCTLSTIYEHAMPSHVAGWDYIPHVGWRHVTPQGKNQSDCFDDVGNVVLACQSCYDAQKQLLPGCIPGWYGNAQAACKAHYYGDAKAIDACLANWPRNMTPLHSYAANGGGR